MIHGSWRRSPLAGCCAASLFACVAGYADVVFGGRTFLPVGRVVGAYDLPPYAAGYTGETTRRAEIDPGAEAWQTHPWAYAEHRALASGSLPLWNAHNGLGHPLLLRRLAGMAL